MIMKQNDLVDRSKQKIRLIVLLLVLCAAAFPLMAAQVGGVGSNNGEISTGTIEVQGAGAIKFPDGSIKPTANLYYTSEAYEGGYITIANSADYTDEASASTRFTFTPPRPGTYEVTYQVPIEVAGASGVDKTVVMKLNDGANGSGTDGEYSSCGATIRGLSAAAHIDCMTLTLRKYFTATSKTIYLRYKTSYNYINAAGSTEVGAQYIYSDPSVAPIIKEAREIL